MGNEARNVNAVARVTAMTLEKVDQAAAAAGVSRSTWIADTIERALYPPVVGEDCTGLPGEPEDNHVDLGVDVSICEGECMGEETPIRYLDNDEE
ncbi:MAG: hypothetical protein WCV88_02075 [Patescibacteria group bacterium]|jgi:hypothetical protein